jgi:hypothetical protein
VADYLTLAYRLAFKQAEGKNGKLFSDGRYISFELEKGLPFLLLMLLYLVMTGPVLASGSTCKENCAGILEQFMGARNRVGNRVVVPAR